MYHNCEDFTVLTGLLDCWPLHEWISFYHLWLVGSERDINLPEGLNELGDHGLADLVKSLLRASFIINAQYLITYHWFDDGWGENNNLGMEQVNNMYKDRSLLIRNWSIINYFHHLEESEITTQNETVISCKSQLKNDFYISFLAEADFQWTGMKARFTLTS